MKVFKAAFVIWIAFNVIEEIARLWLRKQIKSLARLRHAQLKIRFSRLAGVLEARLSDQAMARILDYASDRMIQARQIRHSGDALNLKLLDLPFRVIRHVEQAVLERPDTGAMICPTAEATVGAGHGPRGRWAGHEGFKARPGSPAHSGRSLPI